MTVAITKLDVQRLLLTKTFGFKLIAHLGTNDRVGIPVVWTAKDVKGKTPQQLYNLFVSLFENAVNAVVDLAETKAP